MVWDLSIIGYNLKMQKLQSFNTHARTMRIMGLFYDEPNVINIFSKYRSMVLLCNDLNVPMEEPLAVYYRSAATCTVCDLHYSIVSYR